MAALQCLDRSPGKTSEPSAHCDRSRGWENSRQPERSRLLLNYRLAELQSGLPAEKVSVPHLWHDAFKLTAATLSQLTLSQLSLRTASHPVAPTIGRIVRR